MNSELVLKLKTSALSEICKSDSKSVPPQCATNSELCTDQSHLKVDTSSPEV